MKNKMRTLPAKIICFILCVFTFTMSAASVVGSIFMIAEGIYVESEEETLDSLIYGHLSGDSYQIMRAIADELQYSNDFRVDDVFTSSSSNIRYKVLSPDGKILGCNYDESRYPGNEAKYVFYYSADTEGGIYYLTNHGSSKPYTSEELYTVSVFLESGYPIGDVYSLLDFLVATAYDLRFWIYAIGIASIILFITSFIILMCISGRKPDNEEIRPGLLNNVPFDIISVVSDFALVLLLQILSEIDYDEVFVALGVAFTVIGAAIVLGLCMSIAARLKQHSLIKNTVIWRICVFAWKCLKWCLRKIKSFFRWVTGLIRMIPIVWKTVLFTVGLAFLEFLAFLLSMEENNPGMFVVFFMLKTAVLGIGAIYTSVFMRRLQKGGEALANGDPGHQIDTEKMFWDFKKHGENLNQISNGMAKAVDERLKSERTKAELITNVSHDIKTPLTSIINYASLISENECGSEKHKEYSEVLVRKSEHLKRLLEDIVEISKATTGNLEVDLLPCEANVLLAQAAGEFEERCRDSGLELITSNTEEKLWILADSRRIWRVFENLMSNACKYSLKGSRVYLSLQKESDDVLFIFRNTSREVLSISPDELIGRFVRGDESRSTEGNGLGLSIAQSLTEIQNGKMEISIDGDLFKVVLRFPSV